MARASGRWLGFVLCLAALVSGSGVPAVVQASALASSSVSVAVPILMYHHIGNPVGQRSQNQYYVSQSAFAAQMAYLAGNGFTAVRLEDVFDALQGGASLPANPVAITFDDGNQDNFDLALPVLQQYQMAATFLIPTGWVGKPGHLTWEEIATMQQAGMYFGAHTVTHRYLPYLPMAMAEREIQASKTTLEAHLGQAVRVFAYPYGHTAPTITRLVQQAGFEIALGTSPYQREHTLAERFYLTRYGVYSWTSLSSFEQRLPAPVAYDR